eukprot:11557056-Ditylum_brightwellii.AAC.1
MHNSASCWHTCADARREFAKLRSETVRRDAFKEQIWIRVKGFGWTDLSHAGSKGDIVYSLDQLLDHLVNEVISEQNSDCYQLGAKSKDLELIGDCHEKEMIIVGASAMQEQLEEDGEIDQY